MKLSPKILTCSFIAVIFLAQIACKNQDPVPENIPEMITKVVLTFSSAGGGSTIKVTATDPDGGGVKDIVVDGPINLLKNVQYDLSIELINELYPPGDKDYNITNAVKQEGQEHQFFFSFADGAFSSPTGAGNIKDNQASSSGSINYLDEDIGGLPIGILTSWTTANASSTSKSFRVVLKHQPEIKSSASTSLDGESDLDIAFVLNIN
jgi:hypothetical protein